MPQQTAYPRHRHHRRLVQLAMRPQQFPILLSDLLDEILSIQSAEEVSKWGRSEVGALPIGQIYARSKAMQSGLKMGRMHSYGAPKDEAKAV